MQETSQGISVSATAESGIDVSGTAVSGIAERLEESALTRRICSTFLNDEKSLSELSNYFCCVTFSAFFEVFFITIINRS